MKKLSIGARALRFAKIQQALERLAGGAAKGSTKSIARQIAKDRSAKGILRTSNLPPAIEKPGYGLENLSGLLSGLPAGLNVKSRPALVERLRQISKRFDEFAAPLKTKAVPKSQARERTLELMQRLEGKGLETSRFQRVRSLADTPPRVRIPLERLQQVVGKLKPNERVTAFNPQNFRELPAGAPMWYSPRLAVSGKYLGGEGRNILAKTTEDALKRFGPLGPVTRHIANDNRSLGTAESYLSKFRRRLQSGHNYEQVATFPGARKLPEGQQMFQVVGGDIRRLGPRAFGKPGA